MTRTNVLAELLYRMAVNWKRQEESQLKSWRKRKALRSDLRAMEFLTDCLGECISDSKANSILSVLEDVYRMDTSEIAPELMRANEVSTYSSQYLNLLMQMRYVLDACQTELQTRKKGYLRRVQLYLMGFHNYPRAFLSLEDRAVISAEDAVEYSASYLAFDEKFPR